MSDIIYVGMSVATFIILGLFTWACSKF